MSLCVNKMTVLGHVGGTPTQRMIKPDYYVCDMSVATSESWKDKHSGEKVTKTEWHRVCVYGHLAPICESIVHKGSRVYIEGVLRHGEWTDKAGNKHQTVEIEVNNFTGKLIVLDPKPGSVQSVQRPVKAANDQNFNAGAAAPPQNPPTIKPAAENLDKLAFDDDLPF